MSGPSSPAPVAAWAVRYLKKYHLALVEIPPGRKAPMRQGWNQPGGHVTDAKAACERWTTRPDHGIGAVLGPSGLCSIDVDSPEHAEAVLSVLGIDLGALRKATPTIQGNPPRYRLMFKAPPGMVLGRKTLVWPQEGEDIKPLTLFELRAGPIQDILPPTIHPATGKPYRWLTPPGDDFPPLPATLLELWQGWESYRRELESACPWAPAFSPDAAPRGSGARAGMIGAFNQAHNVEDLLDEHGYKRRGKRWISPTSESELAGVVLLDGRVFSHHASDPLADGHSHDAFDVYRLLEHGGDLKAAIKAASSAALGDGAAGEPPGSSIQKAEVLDMSAFHASAAKAKLEDVQPLLEKLARSKLSRSQQEALLGAVKKSTGVTLQALRADLISELREAGVIKDAESVGTTLVRLAEEAGIELWHDPDKNPWATLKFESHVEYHALRTKAVKRFLQGLYFDKTESSAHSEGVQSALGVLEAKAIFNGKEHAIFVRVAEVDRTVYLDLCDEEWRVVRITEDGWRVIPMADSPVRFRRSRGARPLPFPHSDNGDKTPPELPNIGSVGLTGLSKLINVHMDSREWLLLVAWLLSLLRGHIPYPVLVLSGEQGSGKSTAARLLREIIDPSTTPLRSLPKERRDLFISATNSWVQCFDNVSGLPEWLSDDLCRLATGGGLGTRELYSDQEEILLDARRPCILNGITDFVTRPDLVDRSILVVLPNIPDTARKAEAELLADFEAIRPHILGELLTIVSAGLRRLPHTKLGCLPRLADFVLWVTACEEALGWKQGRFVTGFAETRREMVSAALEGEPIVERLRELVEAGEWKSTATTLLKKLISLAGLDDAKRLPERWPKGPNVLSNKLLTLAPALRQEGIEVKRHPKEGKDPHLWTCQKVVENIVGTVVIVGSRENARFGTTMNDDERRSHDDQEDPMKAAPDKASDGSDGSDDVSATSSNTREIEEIERVSQGDDDIVEGSV